jgi:hypothetical protein
MHRSAACGGRRRPVRFTAVRSALLYRLLYSSPAPGRVDGPASRPESRDAAAQEDARLRRRATVSSTVIVAVRVQRWRRLPWPGVPVTAGMPEDVDEVAVERAYGGDCVWRVGHVRRSPTPHGWPTCRRRKPATGCRTARALIHGSDRAGRRRPHRLRAGQRLRIGHARGSERDALQPALSARPEILSSGDDERSSQDNRCAGRGRQSGSPARNPSACVRPASNSRRRNAGRRSSLLARSRSTPRSSVSSRISMRR